MKRLVKRFRIKRYCTIDFHPQSSGSLKCSHHVLGEFPQHFPVKNSEWEHWLELAMFSYNTSVDEGTKCTPYELVFGKLTPEPFDEPLSQQENLQV